MNNAQDLSYPDIREAVQKLCAQFPGAYWQSMDRDRSYPTEFVNALTQSGFLSVPDSGALRWLWTGARCRRSGA